ncbi:hypothetical protein BP5796_13117 [Coleophoma crateriformis]|uniref:Protein kinase domain-containing protein n=1 Tax=Coleophoma crateriformis TaxID=565419 RepID=A0A3D8Q3L7_9HELO|nr:hypothetical protein BP5796_13117 [Coleophoma crateriformis]
MKLDPNYPGVSARPLGGPSVHIRITLPAKLDRAPPETTTTQLTSPCIKIEDTNEDATSNSSHDQYWDSEGCETNPSSRSHTPVETSTGGFLSPQRPDHRRLSVSSTVVDAGHQDWQEHRNPCGKEDLYFEDSQLRSVAALQDEMGPIKKCGLVEWLSFVEQTSCGIANNEKGHAYLPVGQLRVIMTKRNICEELSRQLEKGERLGEIEALAAEICRDTQTMRNGKPAIQSFRKVFAVLLLVGKAASIRGFIDEDVGDLDLPLIKITHRNRRAILCRSDKRPLLCTETWGSFDTAEFVEKQWRLLAPYFNQDTPNKAKHFRFEPNHVLPFLHQDSNEVKEGAYGRVYMVRIHPQHHNFGQVGVRDQVFAIKQLNQHREATEKAFEREVRALRKFSGAVEHDHVVTLLATYEQGGRFFLVFPCGQSHLLEYWEQDGPRNVRWVAQQCEGLADALLLLHQRGPARAHTHQTTSDCFECRADHSIMRHLRRRLHGPGCRPTSESGQFGFRDLNAINSKSRRWSFSAFDGLRTRHECVKGRPEERGRGRRSARTQPQFQASQDFGRHGDIKPQNIIWYRHQPNHQGVLKLADFGQAELNSRWTRTRAREVAYSRTCRPPECDLAPHEIGQNYDVWSLGCVFLEFVAWAVGGRERVEQFSQMRKTRDSRVALDTDAFFIIIPAVNAAQERAKVKPEVTQYILELRRDKNCNGYLHGLLDLIEQHMLVVDRKQRWDSRRVHGQLVNLLEKYYDKDGSEYTNPPSDSDSKACL